MWIAPLMVSDSGIPRHYACLRQVALYAGKDTKIGAVLAGSGTFLVLSYGKLVGRLLCRLLYFVVHKERPHGVEMSKNVYIRHNVSRQGGTYNKQKQILPTR